MLNRKFDLSGKTALITGGAGLLGLQHAIALLECHAQIILTDRDSAMLDKAKRTLVGIFPQINLHTHILDVTSEESVNEAVSLFKSKQINIDILINNAAIDAKVSSDDLMSNSSRLENFDLSEWNRQIEVGLTGAFICSKYIGYEMSLNGGGVIVNIASDLSVIAPDQRLYNSSTVDESLRFTKPVTYSVIKHGLIGLTKYLSTYWPDKNVRCNALSPGGIFTNQGPEFVGKLKERIPLGRMAEIDEYHAAIQFLSSDASRYMTGQNLILDGGRSVW